MGTGIARVGVLGAGTMGHALALVHALGGLEVRLQDNSRRRSRVRRCSSTAPSTRCCAAAR